MADTKISALTADATIEGTEELPANDAGANKKITVDQIKTYSNTAPFWTAGDASSGWPFMEFGTLLTSPIAGKFERRTVPYFTHSASGRGVIFVPNIVTLQADKTGANAAGGQAIFASANDSITLASDVTYMFELFLGVTNGTATCTKSLIFNAGTAVYDSIRYRACGQHIAINTTGISSIASTALSNVHVDTAASVVVLPTSTNGAWWIKAKGIIRIGIGGTGTWIPQFAFSADPTGTVLIKKNSWCTITPIGPLAFTSVGSWA